MPGIYLFGPEVVKLSTSLKVSDRNELEIADLVNAYLLDRKLNYELLPDTCYWTDMGTTEGLLDATLAVKNMQFLNNRLEGSPEVASFEKGLISEDKMWDAISLCSKSSYGKSLKKQFLIMREK
ncbi:sugar phosphate nucleotidyltransferase [Paracoccaceae bacterium]|nr:sugar phosphate nucleotidyltransferase [Paracoccaceae bacterium]